MMYPWVTGKGPEAICLVLLLEPVMPVFQDAKTRLPASVTADTPTSVIQSRMKES